MKREVSYRKLFEGTNLDLYYGSNHVLYLDWYGYTTTDSVKEGGLAFIKNAELFECYRAINDNRRLKGTWSPALHWVKDEAMPSLHALGVQKIAHIYSPDLAAQYSIDRLKETDSYSMLEIFADLESATQWLTGYSFTAPRYSGLQSIPTIEGPVNIDVDRIYFISKHERRTMIQTKEQQYSCPWTLAEWEEKLETDDFKRIHKSYIVNLNMIDKLKYHAGGYYRAYFKDFGKAYVTVSRIHSQELKEVLKSRSHF